MKKLRVPNLEESGALIALFAVIFGGWARLFAPWLAGFPVNDGGMFHDMILAVQNNQFRLPLHVAYNGLNLPFAYPPLGFYSGAFLSRLLDVSALDVLRWLPALVSAAAIPAFYWLAKSLLNSSFQGGVATFLYAFIPRAMSWSVMGGGLTRSFGVLFLLLTVASVYRLFQTHDRKFLAGSILFSGLTILSHPEAALHAAAFCALTWLFVGRSKRGALNAALVGLGAVAISAPWWATLLARFGMEPFVSAAQTGSHSAVAILIPLLYTLTDEPATTFIAALGVFGFAFSLQRGKRLLPAAYILPFIVEPRSSPVYAMIPLAMLASLFLSEVVLPALTRPVPSLATKIFIFYLAAYTAGNAFHFGTQLAGTSVSAANRQAFAWVKSNTPPDSRFLVLTGETDIFCDGVSEWFPALAGRASLTTIQGLEWLPGKFAAAAQTQRAVQSCLNGGGALNCIEEKTREGGIEYDYLYIASQSPLKSMCRATQPASRGSGLLLELQRTDGLIPVYEGGEVFIFRRRASTPFSEFWQLPPRGYELPNGRTRWRVNF